MILLRYIGNSPMVKVGLLHVKPGETLGEAGSEGFADVIVGPGVINDLSPRKDFVAVNAVRVRKEGESHG